MTQNYVDIGWDSTLYSTKCFEELRALLTCEKHLPAVFPPSPTSFLISSANLHPFCRRSSANLCSVIPGCRETLKQGLFLICSPSPVPASQQYLTSFFEDVAVGGFLQIAGSVLTCKSPSYHQI